MDAKFVYNENGLRVQKIVNGVVTDYVLHGKNVVHMTSGADELHSSTIHLFKLEMRMFAAETHRRTVAKWI